MEPTPVQVTALPSPFPTRIKEKSVKTNIATPRPILLTKSDST